MSQKITPNIWFNGDAKEAVDYYLSIFPDGEIIDRLYYPKSKEEGLADFQLDMAGKELVIDFRLADLRFTAINAGGEFRPNASISFFVNFDPSRDDKAREHLDELWDKLMEGGKALMELNSYPFSEYYGWVQDRYGVSWQLILTDPEGDPLPMIIPSLMFSGANTNRAEEAMNFYTSVFKDSKVGLTAQYETASGPARAGSLMYADFTLANQWFTIMDSGVEMDAPFSEGVSLLITCDDQAEIDYFWSRLSTVPEAEQCGWCKDQFGVSWQVCPTGINELTKKPGAYKNMMEMKKLVIADF